MQDLQTALEEAQRSAQLGQLEAEQKGAALRQMQIRLAQVSDSSDGSHRANSEGLQKHSSRPRDGDVGGGAEAERMQSVVADWQQQVVHLEREMRTAATAHLADLRQMRHDHSRCARLPKLYFAELCFPIPAELCYQ